MKFTCDDKTYINPLFVDNVQKKFVYQKNSHLRDWVSQIQGKETTGVPTFVLEAVVEECKATYVSSPNELTPVKLRKMLKKLKLNKYYNKVHQIREILTGAKFEISPVKERQILNMFEMIQEPYKKHQPHDRKSFLSYSYILHKFFLMCDMHEYTKYVPLPKKRENIYKLELVFQRICQELGWTFIPSV